MAYLADTFSCPCTHPPPSRKQALFTWANNFSGRLPSQLSSLTLLTTHNVVRANYFNLTYGVLPISLPATCKAPVEEFCTFTSACLTLRCGDGSLAEMQLQLPALLLGFGPLCLSRL